MPNCDKVNNVDIVVDNCCSISSTQMPLNSAHTYRNVPHFPNGTQTTENTHRNMHDRNASTIDLLSVLVGEQKITDAATELSSSSSNSSAATPVPTTAISSAQSPTAGTATSSYKSQRLLKRPKRYLSFPEGSTLTVAVCFTVGIIGNPRYDYMSFGLNWGTGYDLPNNSWILNHLHGFSRHPVPIAALRRRTRRALYQEVEMFIDNMGYDGRDCVLRALCESRQFFQKPKMGMIGEMMRVIFSLPKQRLYTRELRENPGIETYDEAYRNGHENDCETEYNCDFSLLELAFGKYSTPPEKYYFQ
ncbi:uncharacterized protein LOC119686397 [Teleopsis dalmanni]|nr:uncharacterized protein LOC119664486 [Teleopsis dalmanni]XP_037956900.1 uncharacterized protein LOC119686397 [Teleopsis dalmanni]